MREVDEPCGGIEIRCGNGSSEQAFVPITVVGDEVYQRAIAQGFGDGNITGVMQLVA